MCEVATLVSHSSALFLCTQRVKLQTKDTLDHQALTPARVLNLIGTCFTEYLAMNPNNPWCVFWYRRDMLLWRDADGKPDELKIRTSPSLVIDRLSMISLSLFVVPYGEMYRIVCDHCAVTIEECHAMKKYETETLLTIPTQHQLDELKAHEVHRPSSGDSFNNQLWIMITAISVVAASMIWLLANVRGRSDGEIQEENPEPVDLNEEENRREE